MGCSGKIAVCKALTGVALEEPFPVEAALLMFSFSAASYASSASIAG